jgi:cyclic pyranopterin phosphate synthase
VTLHDDPRAAAVTGTGTTSHAPRDRFGRVIDYLRISVTDRCNLRCVYCMPLEHPDLAEGSHLLTADEIEMVVRCATAIGFRKFRLTGGEPTLRSDIVEICRRISATPGVADLAMTTNGIRMPELATELRDAGLRRVNVHVDSLSAVTLPRVMRLGSVEKIIAGIEAAEAAGLTPIKLNIVVTKDFNDSEVAQLARLTLERDWHVRFIELMPLGSSTEARLSVTNYVSNVDTRARIEAELGALERVPSDNPNDECENFCVAGAPGVIGFISPVSKPYCGACNRMRMTADGRFHLCLLNDDELDVRAALRADAPLADREKRVKEILLAAVSGKPTGHRLGDGLHTRGKRMHQIGG